MPHAVHTWAERAIAICREQGIGHYLTFGTVLRGWALAMQGQGEAGLTQLHQGLEAARAAGAAFWRPLVLAMLAEVYGRLGQIDEGLAVVSQALAWVEQTGERRDEAELYQLKGTLLQQATGDVQKTELAPEAYFLKAIDIARHQQARSLELRAASSLSRLWQQQDKRHEAYELLATVYNWFTEEFDTLDLQEAKALA